MLRGYKSILHIIIGTLAIMLRGYKSKLHRFRPLGDFLSSEKCQKKFWSDYFQQIEFFSKLKIVLFLDNSLIFNAL